MLSKSDEINITGNLTCFIPAQASKKTLYEFGEETDGLTDILVADSPSIGDPRKDNFSGTNFVFSGE